MNFTAQDVEQAVHVSSGAIPISIIISIITIIVSIYLAMYAREQENNIRFMDAFNKVYSRTFTLREQISKVTRQYNKVDFYYELDTILRITLVEEQILDYLTEMENFFALLPGHHLAKHSFKKLVSFAFYQRIVALYPYILRKRKQTKNVIMFSNYVKVIKMMEKMSKIKKQIPLNAPMCYVGIRESDIFYASKSFSKNVCLFSKTPEKEPFKLRLNQNIDHKDMLPYFTKQLLDVIEKKADIRFHFYNQATAYNYPPEILQRCAYVNSKELLNFLNNKLTLKKWFVDHEIPVIPYETFLGKEIVYAKLASRFSGYQNFVVQSCRGGGGVGTFLAKCLHFTEISEKLHELQQYIVSPYIPSVSANTHVFIGEKQTVLSPGSIQIVEVHSNQLFYRGGDFVAFRDLPATVKNEIRLLSLKIADLLREKGYRGIAGIDFIIDDKNQIFCSEINPRFQASTSLIDQYLKKNVTCSSEATSCFALNQMAFEGRMVSTLCFDNTIDLSCYYYYSDGIEPRYFAEKYKLLKDTDVDVFSDGMEYYLDNGFLDKDSYLFRAVFPHAICKISPDTTLWINDNISVRTKPADGMEIKVALLNQGVRTDDTIVNVKSGVYESIDIAMNKNSYFQEKTAINCAYGIHLSEYSPYFIKYENGAEQLYYYHEHIATILIEKEHLTNLPEIDKKILFLATDRLRIKLISGCENKNMGKGCQFCNLPISEYDFTLEQIQSALLNLEKENLNFRHILLGGGSCLEPQSWEKLIAICTFLKNNTFYSDKPISIMTMLPPSEMLIRLKQAGVEEVAFNLEIADESLARRLMPGKRSNGKDAYYEIFREAVKIFGVGKVRSALLVGLDKEQDLYNEICTLAELGVLPCLSAFRALPKSDFANQLGPDNQYLLNVYQKTCSLLDSQSGNIHELGPSCPYCKNNMLGL